MKKIVVIEPYYGGSHKAFLDALCRQLPCRFELHTLPARKWKWRMRMAAPFFAARCQAGVLDLSGAAGIFCSSFLDVATFKGLLSDKYKHLPVYTYFHENQFAYPVQVKDERDFHFALTNFTTALASDRLAFNSQYNLESFLDGCRSLLAKAPDTASPGWEEFIRDKSKILYPGLDFQLIDAAAPLRDNNKEPVILWNHRWEHDKDPEFFFSTLFNLKRQGLPFKLIIAGQAFTRQPEIFDRARKILAGRLQHFGYASSRKSYITLLKQANLVVSTARHEFYGISILEAVRAGCLPLLPQRLSYPELFPKQFLYEDKDFAVRLREVLERRQFAIDGVRLTDRFDWARLRDDYCRWFRL